MELIDTTHCYDCVNRPEDGIRLKIARCVLGLTHWRPEDCGGRTQRLEDTRVEWDGDTPTVVEEESIRCPKDQVIIRTQTKR